MVNFIFYCVVVMFVDWASFDLVMFVFFFVDNIVCVWDLVVECDVEEEVVVFVVKDNVVLFEDFFL